ncbi:MAG: SDR family oxidoreductase [Alphaproteobacteria bacterium]|nr:SDR family oxidoreductase [Alphaproteobacteria bacterium]
MIDLSGKTILVTGGSRGIGAAIVRAVGGAGATVVLHYGRSEAAAQALQDELPRGKCHLVQADLVEPDSAERIWADATAAAGPIDALVNNAGIFEAAPLDMEIEAWRARWRRVLQVNLISPAELCRHAIIDFRGRGGGRIVNVSSRAAFRGEVPEQMPYGASKGGLVALTKTIARGYAKDGVLAFGIAPGFVATEMVSENVDAAKIAAVVADIPLGEMADADEIGALTAFLCSDHARHLTGATFDVNGASYVR